MRTNCVSYFRGNGICHIKSVCISLHPLTITCTTRGNTDINQAVGKHNFNCRRNCLENNLISSSYLCSTVGQCKIINNALLINYRWFSKLYFLINVVSMLIFYYADFLKKVKFIRVKFLSLLIEQAPTLLQRVEEDFKSITG